MISTNPERMTREVIELFRMGLSPSQIDERMNLVRGTAKNIVTTEWRHDKEQTKMVTMEERGYLR